MLSLCSQFLYNIVKAFLIDSADTLGGKLQGNPFFFFGQVIALGLQVGQKPALGLDIGVRHIMSRKGPFTCDLTYSCHAIEILSPEKNREAKVGE
jgi:hypothetical protein